MPLALIVEDDEDIRLLFSNALESGGFEVVTAASAKEGIRMLDKHTPDIAFIDMNMPEFPGTIVLAHIKATPQLARTKSVVVTANTRSDSRAEELGADLFLLKPVPIADMLRMARRLTGMPETGQLD